MEGVRISQHLYTFYEEFVGRCPILTPCWPQNAITRTLLLRRAVIRVQSMTVNVPDTVYLDSALRGTRFVHSTASQCILERISACIFGPILTLDLTQN